MQYHVSRGNQTYGPYTRADLERYVASGHILLNDMAKSDEMGEWIPVGQILNPAPTQPAKAFQSGGQGAGPTGGFASPELVQPYHTPPRYAQPSPYPDPPNLHWVLVLLFDLLTCGLFQFIWNLVIAAWLKRVRPNSKALFYYIAGYALLLIYGGSAYPGYMGILHHSPVHTHFGFGLLGLAGWVLRLVARFSVKTSLEEHFNTAEPIGYNMNPVMLFFFGGLYIQAELNRINEIRQAIRYRDAAR